MKEPKQLTIDATHYNALVILGLTFLAWGVFSDTSDWPIAVLIGLYVGMTVIWFEMIRALLRWWKGRKRND